MTGHCSEPAMYLFTINGEPFYACQKHIAAELEIRLVEPGDKAAVQALHEGEKS